MPKWVDVFRFKFKSPNFHSVQNKNVQTYIFFFLDEVIILVGLLQKENKLFKRRSNGWGSVGKEVPLPTTEVRSLSPAIGIIPHNTCLYRNLLNRQKLEKKWPGILVSLTNYFKRFKSIEILDKVSRQQRLNLLTFSWR